MRYWYLIILTILCLGELGCSTTSITSVEGLERGSNELSRLAEKVRAEPENSSLRLRYAEELLQANEHKAAENQLEQAISLAPDKIEPRLRLGQTLVDQGNFDAAQTHLANVIATWPNDARGHLVMGYCLKGQDKMEDARAEFQKVVSLTGEPRQKASAHLGLAAICESLGDQEKANRHYGYALVIVPQLHDVLVRVEKERLWPRSVTSGSTDPTRRASVADRRKLIEDLVENSFQE
jgi:Tfp pilus assembly protein PilF